MIMIMMEPRPPWRKSSYSNGSSSCVEVGHTGPQIAVRDTKNPDGPRLAIPAGRWQAFVRTVKDR
jgi:hypothetical protein